VLNYLTVLNADAVNCRAYPPPTGFVCPVPPCPALCLVDADGQNRDYLDVELRE
jgi:hypothetical protein